MMPKPIALDNGSGMHVNVSLWKDNKNLFFDADDKYAEVSETCEIFWRWSARPCSCAGLYSRSDYKFMSFSSGYRLQHIHLIDGETGRP